MHSFNAATDLLQLATESYVIAAACTHLGIDNITDLPKNIQEDDAEGFAYFNDVASNIVDLAFQPLEIVDGSFHEPHCICRSDIDDEMVYCKNNSCKRGSWFHLSCMNMTAEDVPERDYYCSVDCAKSSKKRKGVLSSHTTTDHVYEYSKTLLHRGLGERVRSDAIRQNDGERMLMHWKYDMLEFESMNHPKHFIEGYSLLTDVNGGASKRIAHQIKWNRTVNLTGGKGKNNSMGVAMEILNKEFKQAVKSCGRDLTPSAVKRYSRVLGMRKEFQRIFDTKKTRTRSLGHQRGARDVKEDTLELAQLLLDSKCLQKIPGRSHNGFSNFTCQRYYTNQEGFLKKVEKHKEKRVMRMDIASATVTSCA